MVHTVDDMKVLKDCYCIVLRDDRHWRRSVKMLRNKDGMEWASALFHLHYVFRFNSKAISSAQAIQLSKIANLSTAIVRHGATLTVKTQGLLSYVQTFIENYDVRFGGLRLY